MKSNSNLSSQIITHPAQKSKKRDYFLTKRLPLKHFSYVKDILQGSAVHPLIFYTKMQAFSGKIFLLRSCIYLFLILNERDDDDGGGDDPMKLRIQRGSFPRRNVHPRFRARALHGIYRVRAAPRARVPLPRGGRHSKQYA